MNTQATDARMISRLFFRLLPIQILLAAIGAVNGIVSSLFASNFVGTTAMSAISLYAPVNQFVTAVSTMLVGGSQIICGKYMGKNQVDRTQSVFSLDLLFSLGVGLLLAVLLAVAAGFDLTGFLTGDAEVRRVFNQYLIGQVIGLVPLIVGQQLSAFLSLENRTRRTIIASVAFILTNLALNFLFVQVMRLEAFGLALASSLGLWVFFAIQAQYFTTGKAMLHFRLKGMDLRQTGEILSTGFPGAVSNGYQTLRRLIVNALILHWVGNIGLSAFAASDSVLGIVWAVPTGMLAVSRMLMSVSIGEEDRQTLKDVMRTAMYRCVPIMFLISCLLAIFAGPLTRMFYQDVTDPVYALSIGGFRILPFCMPLSLIYMHFVCYGQASNKQFLVHFLSLLDGVVCVAGFTALLIPFIGMNSVYFANILNGVTTTVVIVLYAWIRGRRMPRNMDELMVIPADFGVPPEQRMDITVRSMEEVVTLSRQIQEFCGARGIDARRAYLAGLSMEEMAGNVVAHGFTKDRKKHAVDVRVVHKNEDLILRIKDDCVPFDPAERRDIVDPEDPVKNIGIRMVYNMAEEIKYQNILGLNVLTIRI